jgi:hypothetical protein
VTRLAYETAGRERSFDVTSLISWRGDSYVVHLTGFKYRPQSLAHA